MAYPLIEGQICTLCKKYKFLDNFYTRSDSGKKRKECIECAKNRSNKYYEEHTEERIDYGVAYYKNNTEQVKGTQKIYRNSNPARNRKRPQYFVATNPEWTKNYSNSRYATNLLFNLSVKLRTRLYKALKRNFTGKAKKAAKSIELLGCTAEFYKIYLEGLFTEGMTWEKYMKGDIVADHYPRPVCSFDLRIPEEQYKCFHYSNTRPMWNPDNLKKTGEDRKLSIRNKGKLWEDLEK